MLFFVMRAQSCVCVHYLLWLHLKQAAMFPNQCCVLVLTSPVLTEAILGGIRNTDSSQLSVLRAVPHLPMQDPE